MLFRSQWTSGATALLLASRPRRSSRRARQPPRSTTTTRPCRALSPCSFSLMLFLFELMLLPFSQDRGQKTLARHRRSVRPRRRSSPTSTPTTGSSPAPARCPAEHPFRALVYPHSISSPTNSCIWRPSSFWSATAHGCRTATRDHAEGRAAGPQSRSYTLCRSQPRHALSRLRRRQRSPPWRSW